MSSALQDLPLGAVNSHKLPGFDLIDQPWHLTDHGDSQGPGQNDRVAVRAAWLPGGGALLRKASSHSWLRPAHSKSRACFLRTASLAHRPLGVVLQYGG